QITTCLVGHVTKEGSLAGPRIIEHLVDTVLYFEGERMDSFRMLRAVKNRFGSVSEVGIFEMGDAGLREVLNPSVLFMQARPEPVSGTAICATMEGRRPLLAEVQALVNPTHLPSPKRVAQGLDPNRLAIDVAVLERRAGMRLSDRDVFVSVTGGLRVVEPALDLAVCMALASALRDRPLPAHTAYFGEVSLTGEVRPVGAPAQRLAEAAKMGLRRALIPADQGVNCDCGVELIEVRQLVQALARDLA
ncbi:MAG: magnesium chelatase domain-containing protein, partial [Candidatus Geothermincolia bacterium]